MAASTPQTGPHTGLGSAALVRLLAAWGHGNPAGTGEAAVERLGRWLSWTDAVAISAVLARQAPGGRAPTADVPAEDAAALLADADRLQAELLQQAQRLARPPDAAAAQRHPADRRRYAGDAAPTDDPLDLAPHLRRYRSAQRDLADAIAPLRQRLRTACARLGEAGVQLAALDAALDEAVTPRERQALTGVTVALARRFDLHRRAAEPPQDAAPAARVAAPDDTTAAAEPEWLQRFRLDQQRALQAELALRWSPVAGLVTSLRASLRPHAAQPIAATPPNEAAAVPGAATGTARESTESLNA